MLELTGVGLKRSGVTLLDGFGLRFPDPGVYLLCGPCGSGKSLLARILSGRLRPDRGIVMLDGTSLYRLGDFRAAIGAIVRPPPAVGPLFLATAGQLPEEDESLYEYLDVELWRAGAPSSTLVPFWEVLERAIPAARRRSLSSLSSSELALAYLALGAAVPARVVVLDGLLGIIDTACLETARRLLGLIEAQERFVILTAPPEVAEVGRAQRIELAGSLPVRLVSDVEQSVSAA